MEAIARNEERPDRIRVSTGTELRLVRLVRTMCGGTRLPKCRGSTVLCVGVGDLLGVLQSLVIDNLSRIAVVVSCRATSTVIPGIVDVAKTGVDGVAGWLRNGAVGRPV